MGERVREGSEGERSGEGYGAGVIVELTALLLGFGELILPRRVHLGPVRELGAEEAQQGGGKGKGRDEKQ